MYLLGYSLDNLSLMALTISTGFVVDDAIVMVENIARYIEMGDSPLDAALKGAGEIGFTIVSLTVSLIAVLIPLLFMGDIVGRLFREFAVTLAVTIILSAVVSLTLTPMMAAKLLKHKPESEQGWFYRWSEKGFKWMIDRYASILRLVLRHQAITLLVAVGTLAADVLPLPDRAERFLPRAGYGCDSGHYAGAGIHQLRVHVAQTAGDRKRAAARPGGPEYLFVYRRRRHEYNRKQRTNSDPRSSRLKNGLRMRVTSSGACSRSSSRWRGSLSTCNPFRTSPLKTA